MHRYRRAQCSPGTSPTPSRGSETRCGSTFRGGWESLGFQRYRLPCGRWLRLERRALRPHRRDPEDPGPLARHGRGGQSAAAPAPLMPLKHKPRRWIGGAHPDPAQLARVHDETSTSADLLIAWREAVRAAELAERLAALAL